MTPTKDQQAQEYAEERVKAQMPYSNYSMPHNKQVHLFDGYDIEQAFEDGHTACEQSMWRSVEDEEPPIGKLILCRDSNDASLAYYDGKHISDAANPREKVQMPFWMPIPPIPDTNTEKK